MRIQVRWFVSVLAISFLLSSFSPLLGQEHIQHVEVVTFQFKGEIVSEDGRPVPGADVTMEPVVPKNMGPIKRRKLQSSADGRFNFADLESCPWIVSVKHPDFLEKSKYIPWVKKNEERRFELASGNTITGKVDTHNGKKCPIVLEFVSKTQKGPYVKKVEFLEAPKDFAFSALPHGKGVITVYDGVTSAKEAQIELTSPSKDVLVLLSRRARLVAKVIDEMGKPVAGVKVLVRSNGEQLKLLNKENVLRTNAEGRASFSLPIGKRYTLFFGNGDYGPVTRKAKVFSGVNEISVRIKKRFHVEGRLLSSIDGKPLVGYGVKCFPADRDERIWLSLWEKDREPFVVDNDGTFFFENVVATRGRTHFSIGPPSTKHVAFVTEKVRLEPERGVAKVNFEIEPPGSLNGTCEHEFGYNTQLRVRLRQKNIFPRYSRYINKGYKFSFSAITPGEYSLEVDVNSKGSFTKAMYTKKITVKSGEELNVKMTSADVDKEAVGTAHLSGRLVDESGQSINNQRMSLHRVTKDSKGYLSKQLTTDSQGRFSVKSLLDGEWRVYIDNKNYVTIDTKIEIGKGEKKTRDFKLSKGLCISGELFGEDKRTVSNFEMSLFGPVGETRGFYFHDFEKDSRFSFQKLPKGKFSLELKDKVTGIKEITLESVMAGTEGIFLQIAKREKLSVKVVDINGESLPSVEIYLRRSHSYSFGQIGRTSFWTDVNGCFETPVKPNEEYDILVNKSGFCPALAACRPGVEVTRIQLERALTVNGLALDEEGTPLAGYCIFAVGEDSRAFNALDIVKSREHVRVIDEHGNFTLTNVPNGKITFKIRGEKGSAEIGECKKTLSQSTHAGERLKLTFARPGSVVGNLISSDGIGMRNCLVTLSKPGQRSSSQTTSTFEDGAFLFPSVGQGNYVIRWKKSEGHNPLDSLGTKVVTVRKGERNRVTLKQNSWQDISLMILEILVPMVIEIALAILFFVLLIINRSHISEYGRLGLSIALLIFFLEIPARGYTFFSMFQGGIPQAFKKNEMAFMVGCVLGLVIAGILIFWHCAIWIVAAVEWKKYNEGSFPSNRKVAQGQGMAMASSFLFGALFAVITVAIFHLLKVEDGDTFKFLTALMSSLQGKGSSYRLLIAVSSFIGIAIKEEVIFRGALQGFLLRLSKDNKWLEVLSIAIVSFLWALLHLANASAPWLKVLQIFIFGLIIGELARRKSFECAVMAHVGLNVTAAVIAFLMA